MIYLPSGEIKIRSVRDNKTGSFTSEIESILFKLIRRVIITSQKKIGINDSRLPLRAKIT